MLLAAAMTIILAWPEASPEAVRRAQELGAQTVVVPLSGKAPSGVGVEVIAATAASGDAIAAARQAGYSGVMIHAPEREADLRLLLASHGRFVRIVSLAPSQAHWDVSPATAAVRAGQWPGLRRADEAAGATELPWINANLHLYSWLEGFFPGREPVLDYEPPAETLQFEGAETALAEAWAFGGSVILRLPSVYREGLARGDARALAAWERLRQVAEFLRRSGGGPREPASTLAILIPAWNDEFEEILNLAWRQQLSPRAIPAERFDAPRGLRLAAVPNHTPPPETQRRLRAFAAAGGHVLVTPEPGRTAERWWGEAGPPDQQDGLEMFRLGRGTIRLLEEPALDPFVFALDLREQLGMDNPLGRGLHGLDVRLWNASTVLPVLRRSGQGRMLVVLIAYGRWLDHDFLAGARGSFRAARMEMPAAPAAAVKLMPRGGRVEWNQPGLHRIAIVTLEESGR
ncbi:MAG: hypothetical protein N2036_11965 [Bryobacteraceae bacterium]|nr:hypothetical protein [Bryobacteraceae bacterium]